MNLKYETKAIHAIVTNQLSDENAQMGMDGHNKNTMKKLITFVILLSFMTSCSIIQKTKKVDREKVEQLETEKTEISIRENSKLEESVNLHFENQLISLLSALNWQYAGKDSAEIEITQTDSGIKIKTKGSGTAEFKTHSEKTLKKSDSINTNRTKFVQNNLSKIDKSVLTKSSSEKVQKEKETKRWDFSIAFWIVLAIIIIVLIVVYALYKRSGGTKFFEKT